MSETEQNVNADSPLIIIGWREWLSLPDLGVPRIKAKIDTGARSSSLHAYDIEQFEREGCSMVRFKVHPIQRREQLEICCLAEVHDIRSVRTSSGEATDRIVIQTTASWLDQTWTIDLTLADRSQMGFRMLVGREAMRGRMLVDPGRSYFGGRPKRKTQSNNS
ncbi:ATP-dependent zinc protease [Rubripirellula sp.]|nr:ATP-dependent zinc protease [Rubripirellula sp.]MDA7914962.1 ATP-dependent zinc protease [bacterium]MDB4445703.1 ATP-dependent zinc protease [bacterium]MDB4624620.1 ATP-dependent zinc protease [Rubripirellula sp.]